MNKQDIVDILCEGNDTLTKKDTKDNLDTFLNALAKGIANEDKVVLSGFGTFYKKVVGCSESGNIYYAIKFKPSQRLKKIVRDN